MARLKRFQFPDKPLRAARWRSLATVLALAQLSMPSTVLGQSRPAREAEMATLSAAIRKPYERSSIDALVALLSSSDEGVRQLSADALSRIGLPAVAPVFTAWAQKGKLVEVSSVWILARMGSGVVGGNVADTFRGDRLERLRAAYSQAKQGDRPGQRALLEMLADDTGEIASMAAVALADLRTAAIGDLVSSLAHRKPGVASQASTALVLMGDLAVPALRGAATSSDKLTRFLAIQSLAQIVHGRRVNPMDFGRPPMRGYSNDIVEGFLQDPGLRGAAADFLRWQKDPSSFTRELER